MLSSPGDPTPACSEREAEKSKCAAPAAGEAASLHTRDRVLPRLRPLSRPVAVEAPLGDSRGAVRQPCWAAGRRTQPQADGGPLKPRGRP